MGAIQKFLTKWIYYGSAPYYADQNSFLFAGSRFDYKNEAGVLYDNSVVASCINFVYRKLSESKLQIEKYDTVDKKWKKDDSDSYCNSLLDAFAYPNPYYDHTVLWYGGTLSLSCKGIAYFYINRGQRNQVVGFDYIPNSQIHPRADRDNQNGYKLITHYEYLPPGGSPRDLEIDDVLVLRWGVDPDNVAVGHSMFQSVYREICAHNSLVTSTASLQRNHGKPGAIISQKMGVGTKPMAPKDRVEILKQFASFVLDKVGMPLFVPVPVDVVNNAFTPREMQVSDLKNDLAAAIAAPYGLDVMMLGLPSKNKTYSNFQEALDAAIENCFIPIATVMVRQLTYQLIDVTRRGMFRFSWDISEVRGLQEDINKLHERIREDYKAEVIDLYTAKLWMDVSPESKDKGLYYQQDKQSINALPEKPVNVKLPSDAKKPTNGVAKKDVIIA